MIEHHFARVHNAAIKLPPLRLAVARSSQGEILGAAGTRDHTQGFFSQTYLDCPLADEITARAGGPVRDADLTESTRALAIPTVCVVGDQDGSTPPDLVRSMADIIPGSQFRIITEAGHIPCVEQPDAVADLISTFLKGARYA